MIRKRDDLGDVTATLDCQRCCGRGSLDEETPEDRFKSIERRLRAVERKLKIGEW